MALDATGRRVHNDRKFTYLIAGGEAAEWTEYQSAEDALDPEAEYEQLERDLMSDPRIAHIDNRSVEQKAADAAAAIKGASL